MISDFASIPHLFSFDPTYGYDLDKLQRMEPPATEPADYVQFWRGFYAQVSKVPLRLERNASRLQLHGYQVWEVYYDIIGDTRVGGWLVTPQSMDKIQSTLICGHGYGGRNELDLEIIGMDRVVFFPLAPGFDLSAAPSRFPVNDAAKHVIHGIQSRETYILRLCAAALWRAIDVVLSLFPAMGNKPIHYLGWSFGGGMGALMLPWEKRYTSAELGQPTFGHHPVRLKSQCAGSGEAVRLYWLKHPEVEKVLGYYDAATAAKYITQPVVFALSCFDPCVPSPGQFAVANGHPGPKRISLFTSGHFAYTAPTEAEEFTLHRENLRELIGQAARPGLD